MKKMVTVQVIIALGKRFDYCSIRIFFIESLASISFCRDKHFVEMPVVWVESIYVVDEKRRCGVASELYNKAEKLASSYGEETLYNHVHPNNDKMIQFLNKRGYNVLNLIEIRKKYHGEELIEKINIKNNEFGY